MKTKEFLQFVLQKRSEKKRTSINEKAAIEVANLISGSFVYQLCERLWVDDFNMDSIAEHLESMYDNNNHFGLVYFIVILAEAVNYDLPAQFVQMAAHDLCIPIISAAIIEDWLDFDYEDSKE